MTHPIELFSPTPFFRTASEVQSSPLDYNGHTANQFCNDHCTNQSARLYPDAEGRFRDVSHTVGTCYLCCRASRQAAHFYGTRRLDGHGSMELQENIIR